MSSNSSSSSICLRKPHTSSEVTVIPFSALAALIVGGAIVYAVNIWSNTQQQRIKAPAEAIQKGVESVKEALQPGS